ncbi:hypothetical protein TDB9533_00209 [Thalassocella blandensis]|nr:hypothetical protein TDB9533_00209 [Thalassocella blandensis]
MKVMVMVKASAASEAGAPPSEALAQAMIAYNEELVKAGILLGGDGLKPSEKGVRIHFSGSNRTVTEGPFAETRELIAGYWLWRVASMEEAIAWVKKCPNPMPDDSDIEIRPIIEYDDLGEAFTPELQEREAALLAEAMGLPRPRFENFPAITITGIEREYSFSTRGNISLQWEEFISLKTSTATLQGESICFGVCTSAKQDGFHYLSGVRTEENTMQNPPASFSSPTAFSSIALAARRYAVFEHKDHISTLCHTIDKIWSQWVLDCGLKIAQAPNFERYTEAFNPQTGLNGIEVWIPLTDHN